MSNLSDACGRAYLCVLTYIVRYLIAKRIYLYNTQACIDIARIYAVVHAKIIDTISHIFVYFVINYFELLRRKQRGLIKEVRYK